MFKAWTPFAILSLFVLIWGLPKIKLAMNQTTTPAFAWCCASAECVPVRRDGMCRTCTMPVSRGSHCDQANTGVGALRFQLALRHRHGLLPGCDCVRLSAGIGPAAIDENILANSGSNAPGHDCDLIHVGTGIRDPLLGPGCCTGFGVHATGWFYPFFGTFLGWLGVALTGSDTSSNALFGSLQRITSQQLGIDPILMCAANSAGGVMGKMVDAQSITIATAATEQVGNEGVIFRFVFWHSVALGSIVGIIVMLLRLCLPMVGPARTDVREIGKVVDYLPRAGEFGKLCLRSTMIAIRWIVEKPTDAIPGIHRVRQKYDEAQPRCGPLMCWLHLAGFYRSLRFCLRLGFERGSCTSSHKSSPS